MPTVITTGDPDKCKVINLIECPACGDPFEVTEGLYIRSDTLGDKVKVCCCHSKGLSLGEEIRVQDSFRRALDHPDGFITVNGVLKKSTDLLKRLEGRKLGA